MIIAFDKRKHINTSCSIDKNAVSRSSGKSRNRMESILGHMPTVKVIFQHLQPISTTVPYKKLTLDLGFFLQTLIA